MPKLFFLPIMFWTSCILHAQPALNLVPWPQEVEQAEGSYALKQRLTISSDFPEKQDRALYTYLRDEMQKNFGITLRKATAGQRADIRFTTTSMATGGKAAYRLAVDDKGIRIESNAETGSFYAIQTLLQLVPAEAGLRKLPFVKIYDHARFEYRGMHLDVGRHFFPLSFIKKYIDFLAYHKFNRFHWHLTDDQGWRIEIKKYPLLTQVGGWRNGTIIGRYPGKGNDNIPYGGFYTQKEIREVVQYAAARHIEVIPEIEMPGHSSAAIAAYPGLSCFPEKPTQIPPTMISRKSLAEQKDGRVKLVQETWGVFEDVFCAGNDSTFLFFQQVIDEVISLFPSKYFHIGGDECPKTHWKICPRCQQRIKDEGLKDEHELQSYFVKRIETYLNSKGRTLIGWDEILEGGLAPNAVVMSWRGEKGGIEAAKQHHNVIMTPGNPVYFDHTQSAREDSVTIGGYNPLDKVYAYEPVPGELGAEEAKYVLGAQANVWTEYIKYPSRVEYTIFPRMSALSEVLWSNRQSRNWEHFQNRLEEQFRRYARWNAHYSTAHLEPVSSVKPAPGHEGVLWHLEKRNLSSGIRYRDASDSNTAEMEYQGPVQIVRSGTYQAWARSPEGGLKGMITQDFHFNKATGRKITLREEPSTRYPGDGGFTLVNGIQNKMGLSRAGEFIGFSGTDCEALIDLGKPVEISEIIVHALEQKTSWIWFPSAFDLSWSADGDRFQPFDEAVSISRSADHSRATLKLARPASPRYLKIRIMNAGTIAAGNPGAGSKAWLMVDEIEVY